MYCFRLQASQTTVHCFILLLGSENPGAAHVFVKITGGSVAGVPLLLHFDIERVEADDNANDIEDNHVGRTGPQQIPQWSHCEECSDINDNQTSLSCRR